MNQSNQVKPISTERLTININTSHWLAGSNKYRYYFTSPLDLTKASAKLSMYQYGIYNSTFNITSAYNNNTYSIIWTNGTVYNFTIPDGYYSFPI